MFRHEKNESWFQVANLLGLFHIPQVSPASTAKALSDKTRFEFFARTVPPDTFQSSALVDIVKTVNWSYVSTVYSEGSYGEYGIEVFHREAQERNVCIAAAEKVPSTADDKEFENIILKLRKKVNAKGIILFTRAEDARLVHHAPHCSKRLQTMSPPLLLMPDSCRTIYNYHAPASAPKARFFYGRRHRLARFKGISLFLERAPQFVMLIQGESLSRLDHYVRLKVE